jgi:guanyl-specific ribonuclease Sa
MQRWLRLGFVLLAAVLAVQWWADRTPDVASPGQATTGEATAPGETAARWPEFLPPEAVATLEAIERGGPFPYDRDGTVFQNRERLLPERPRGYYREYTVVTAVRDASSPVASRRKPTTTPTTTTGRSAAWRPAHE